MMKWLLEAKSNREVPEFPFVTTCLTIGASTSMTTGLFLGSTFRPMYIEWNASSEAYDPDWAGSFMVLDITEAQDTHYCFIELSLIHI